MTGLCLAAALIGAGSPAALAQTTSSTDRAAVIAGLERLMLTGEPRHNEHREGDWLQRAVNDAYRRNDIEIVRLAQRAAVALVPFVSQPIGRVSDPPVISLRKVDWLELPSGYRSTTEILGSWDGGDAIRLEPAWKSGGAISQARPPSATRAGFHQVRLQARIVFEGPAGTVPPAETRNLPEIVYAIYDPADDRRDARAFVFSPVHVSASFFDPALPDVPLIDWLNGTLQQFGGRSSPERDWMPTYCDARTRPADAVPREEALCTLAYFSLQRGFGELWFRTGRIERAGGTARWVLEQPTLQALRLHGPSTSNVTAHDKLSALPALLAQPADTWPTGDVGVSPGDITITPESGSVRFEATIRNNGTADLHGVSISVLAVTGEERGDLMAFVRDIPRGGEARVEGTVALPAEYGALLVDVAQIGEHSPHDFWMPDPTPDDALAFRVVNPRRAPPDYASRLRRQCGPVCRGY